MESQPIDQKNLSPLNIKSFEPFDSSSPDHSPSIKASTPNAVPLYIKFVETNRLKIKTKDDIEGRKGGGKYLKNSLSSSFFTAIRLIKREHMFYMSSDDIPQSKFLKNNYLPEDYLIEVVASWHLRK